MSQHPGSSNPSVSPFVGLVPSRQAEDRQAQDRQARDRGDARRMGAGFGIAATMPIVLVGTLAMSALNAGTAAPLHRPRTDAADPSATIDLTASATTTAAGAAAASGAGSTTLVDIETASIIVPSTYTVKAGDSVSSIAAHFGLATATVLALNGLGWKSLIFPKQVLRLKKASSSTPPSTTPPRSTPPAAPPATPPAGTASNGVTKYTIHSGDTLTSIARKFHVSVQAILVANHLKITSTIYAGRTLLIPAAAPSGGGGTNGGTSGGGSSGGGTSGGGTSGGGSTAPAGTGGTQTIVPLSASMEVNAKTIIAVGKSLNVPTFGLVVALAAAMQESRLQNLHYGDRDSVGLFQQRPSAGWGTDAQLENTTYASELFFGGPRNPNKGKTRGLLDIPGWQSMSVTKAAQSVQISATPNAYAQWEASARAWVAQLG